MAIKKQIKDLEATIKKMEEESSTYWIGKWATSIKINRMKRIVEDLKKELTNRKIKK